LLVIFVVAVSNTIAFGDPIEMSVVIHADRVTHTISPYIYGANQETEFDPGFTAKRLGGNRLTGYNWENNMSNAGSDWYHHSDTYLVDVYGSATRGRADEPAAVIEAFHESLHPGAYSLVTLQMAGYVAADGDGTVEESETAPSLRWREVRFSGGPDDPVPDTGDGVVYMDQLLRYLVARYGRAADLPTDPGPIRGYSLDNEPALWPSTHPRIYPEQLTVADLLRRSEELAAAVKAVDPGAEIFGPTLYGYYAFVALQDAPDWPRIRREGGYEWFLDAYLDRMRQAGERRGVRLLDVLDLHWYPEARGTDRIVWGGSDPTSAENVDARLQAPLSLWHPEYQENSWITRDYRHEPIELIPRIRESIDRYYPGTRLAFTEWAYGAEDHISGGLAVADVLGVFGRYDVYLATYWGGGPFMAGAYELYRLPGWPGDRYGDLNLELTNPDPFALSAYASRDDEGRVHVILINKTREEQSVALTIDGRHGASLSRAYVLDEHSPRVHVDDPVEGGSSSAVRYVVAPMSAVHLVVE
jgi:hypothetical protein